jgi:hypothetical protein
MKSDNTRILIEALSQREEDNLLYGVDGSDMGVEAVQMMLMAGADVTAKDSNGRTALMITTDQHVAKALVYAGADVHAKDRNGETALFQAIVANDVEITSLLIEAGANANAVDGRGETALMAIVKRDDVDVHRIKFAIDAGVDVRATDRLGETALMKLEPYYASSPKIKAIFENATLKMSVKDQLTSMQSRMAGISAKQDQAIDNINQAVNAVTQRRRL